MNDRYDPILTCKPRLIWKVLHTLSIIFLASLSFYLLLMFILSLNSSTSPQLFPLWFGSMWLALLFIGLQNAPLTVHILRSGILVVQWGRSTFVRWDDIDFMWERGFYLDKHIILGSKQFPRTRILAGFYTIFRFKAIYTMSPFQHYNYDETIKILRGKLDDRYIRKYDFIKW